MLKKNYREEYSHNFQAFALKIGQSSPFTIYNNGEINYNQKVTYMKTDAND